MTEATTNPDAGNPYAAPREFSRHEKQACYISTPAHTRSFIGRFVYIYTSRIGTLELSPQALIYTYHDGTALEIGLDKIVEIDRGSYSRLAKPLRLDFISLTYSAGDNQHTIYLTPTRGALTPTWESNKMVEEWFNLLRKATSL